MSSRRDSASPAAPSVPSGDAGARIRQLTQRNIDLINRLEQTAVATRRTISPTSLHTPPVLSHLCIGISASLPCGSPSTRSRSCRDSFHFDPLSVHLPDIRSFFGGHFLSTFILISQNHENELAHTTQPHWTNILSEQENSQMLKALERIEEKLGVPVDEEIMALEEDIPPDELSKQIESAQAKCVSAAKNNGNTEGTGRQRKPHGPRIVGMVSLVLAPDACHISIGHDIHAPGVPL
jgi:hypothetical protein